MNKIFSTLFIYFIVLVIPLKATDGYIKLKDRLTPVYVTNISFLYYGSYNPAPVVVFSFKEQKHKFIKYSFDEIRKIEFVKPIGEKNFAPVYYIKVWLKRGGHFLHGYLLPITKIEGYHYRRKWQLPLEYESSYQNNIFKIKEIIFKERLQP